MSDKILICAPAWLGDMIMLHSLIQILYTAGHELHVLAPKWNVAVLERMPEISKRVVLPITHGELKLGQRYQIAKQLRRENYSRAIIAQNSFKSALIPFFARIPQRTGWLRECRGMLLTDGRKLDSQKLPLMVQRYAALAYTKNTSWDPNDYPLPKLQTDDAMVKDTLARHKLSCCNKILALSPGAAYGKTKQWPSRYYADIANRKLVEGWQVWLFGSANDRVITDEVMKYTQHRCHNLAGRLQLFETVDLISKVTALVSNDSGLLHVSAALEVPVIGIYGSTSPAFTPPLGETALTITATELECQPCFQRTCRYGHLNCLTTITPDRVLGRLDDMLNV